jgi:methylthioribose-1-phosphate isomerase
MRAKYRIPDQRTIPSWQQRLQMRESTLTTFALARQGVPHTGIAERRCLQQIRTYLKALAARDNQLPFYMALPYSTLIPRSRAVLRSSSRSAPRMK